MVKVDENVAFKYLSEIIVEKKKRLDELKKMVKSGEMKLTVGLLKELNELENSIVNVIKTFLEYRYPEKYKVNRIDERVTVMDRIESELNELFEKIKETRKEIIVGKDDDVDKKIKKRVRELKELDKEITKKKDKTVKLKKPEKAEFLIELLNENTKR